MIFCVENPADLTYNIDNNVSTISHAHSYQDV